MIPGLTMRITRIGIQLLRDEASAAGDTAQVEICDAALRYGRVTQAWAECERVIDEAATQAMETDA